MILFFCVKVFYLQTELETPFLTVCINLKISSDNNPPSLPLLKCYASTTRFSTLAGTARAGAPLNNLSKQTPKSHFSTNEPERIEPDHK